MTFILSDKEEVFCIAQQLKRMLKNTSSETLALWVRSRDDLYRNKSKRRSITMHSGQV